MTSKVPPANTYFAVEMLSNVSAHQVAGMFCEAAKKAKTLFFQLESLSVVEFGATKFLRFKSDIADPVKALRVLQEKGHGIVYKEGDGFVLQKGTDTWKVSITRVMASPVRNPQSWRGPRIKYWERQFMAMP